MAELRYIGNGSRIFFIEKRNPVCLIKDQRNIEDRKAFFVFGFSELYDINISCLTVFIGRIIGNIDTLFAVSAFVPFIQKPDDLIFGDRVQHPADLYIAEDLHVFREERMAESKVGIMKTNVFLIHDHEGHQIEKKAAVFMQIFFQHGRNLIFLQELLYYQICSDPDRAASVSFGPFFRHGSIRKVIGILFIGIHHIRVIGIEFSDADTDRDRVLSVRQIRTAGLELNVGDFSFFHAGDLTLHVGDRDSEIVVHGALLFSVIFTLK